MEAALLFPVLLVVFSFLVHIGFYQYHRCIIEQSVHYTLVRGKELALAGDKEYNKMLEQMLDDTLQKHYLTLSTEKVDCYLPGESERWNPTGFIQNCDRLNGDGDGAD